jgi:septal ring factor EnvC (AmiA/AmiB activator)
MKRRIGVLGVALAVTLPLFAGCSSGPSKDQLFRLHQMQEENSALQERLASLEKQKSALQSSVAEDDSRLNKCRSDRAALDAKIQAAKKESQGETEGKP